MSLLSSTLKKGEDYVDDKGVATIGATAMGSPVGGYVADKFVDAPRRNAEGAAEAKKALAQTNTDQYNYNVGQNQKYSEAEGTYSQGMNAADSSFQNARNQATGVQSRNLQQLQTQAATQANDSRHVYQGAILPASLDQMNRSMADSQNAMSLKDYMDPNNAVLSGTRDTYNNEATNVGRQGIADSGILSAMGAQAAGQAFGAGGPMSTGQLQSLYASNQAQSGQAFARTQQQMQSLRDQGLAQSYVQNDKMYQAGQQAHQTATNDIRNVNDVDSAQISKQSNLRGEQANLGADRMGIGLGNAQSDYNINQGQASRGLDLGYRGLDRDSTTENARYGQSAQTAAQEEQRRLAMGYGDKQAQGALIGLGTTAAGAVLGGPTGASIGNSIGQTLGGINAGPPPAQQAQQYQAPVYNYGGGGGQGYAPNRIY